MPINLPDNFYALETSTGLLAQQVEFVTAWIQLRKQMIDNCPGCPGPPIDLANTALAAMNAALRSASQAVNQIAEHEALAGARVAGA